MTTRVYEYKRDPKTGKLKKTGRTEVAGKVKRSSGGGYETGIIAVEDKHGNVVERTPGGVSGEPGALINARLQSEKQAAQQQQQEAQQTQAERNKLHTAQQVVASLNASAQRSGSANRYSIVSDENDNIYIEKRTSPYPNESKGSGRSASPRDSHRSGTDFQTGSSTSRNDGYLGDNNNRDSPAQETESPATQKLRTDVAAQEKREQDFYNGDGFKRIDALANKLTFGKGTPAAQRSWLGRKSQNTVSGLLGYPISFGGFLGSSAEKAKLAGQGLLNPETRRSTAKEAFVTAPKNTPSESVRIATDPTNIIIMAAGGGQALKSAKGMRGRAEIDVGRSKGRTMEADLTEGKSMDLTETQVTARANGKTYTADTRSVGITKPDAQGTLLRSEKTEIVVRNTKTGKEYKGAARTDTQIKPTRTGSKARGTTAQTTNIGRNKAVTQSGKTATKTTIKSPDQSTTRTVTQLGKPQKTKALKNAEDIAYQNTLQKPATASAAKGRTRTLAETEAPLYPRINEDVSARTKPTRQTLSETEVGFISGKKVKTYFDKPPKTKKGVKVRTTESGGSVIEIGPPGSFRKPATRELVPIPERPGPATETLLMPARTNAVPSAFIQAKTAVENVAQAEARGEAASGIAKAAFAAPRAPNTKTRTEAMAQLQPQKPASRTSERTLIGPTQESQRAQKPITKAFEDLGAKLAPRQKQRQNQARDSQQLPRQEQEPVQRQEPVQEFFPEQIQRQRQSQRQSQTPRFEMRQPPVVFPIAGISSEPRSGEQGFAVLVRRKGFFRQVSNRPLTKAEALRLGAQEVRDSAAASFMLKPVGGRATGRKGAPRLDDFSMSKREKGVYVQKREKRISSYGELQEITVKGIQAQMRGGLFK